MSHAIIFTGEDLRETQAHAHEYAKALNCMSDGKQPCGHCLSCRVFEHRNHPDTIYVTASKASSIGVEDVRAQIIAPMATKPFRYRYKIFIIDYADLLTPQAQSALLKTIEEPAPYGVFLFVATGIHGFHETILSRCVVKKVDINTHGFVFDEQLETVAHEVVAHIAHKDVLDALLMYQHFEPYKESKDKIKQILDIMYHIYGTQLRDAFAHGGMVDRSIVDKPRIVSHAKEMIVKNGNVQLALELMLYQLR